MWFRRFRRRREPPPLLLPSLERLSELIERVVELLDQAAPRRTPEPRVVHNSAPEPEPVVDRHLLFLATADGYRLLQREGPAPACGQLLELAEGRFRVLRVRPSPLPADRRRCACLEREEPPNADRTFDR